MFNKKNKSVFSYFARQTECLPQQIALISETQNISYRELDEKVTQLANYLIENGIESGNFVAILLERSIEFVVSCLAILKIGAIYVPINGHYSPQYIKTVYKNSGAVLLITNSQFKAQNQLDDLTTAIFEEIESKSAKAIAFSTPQTSEAYVIYTSGSTGEPKGVISTQAAMMNRFEWVWRHYPFKKHDICCLKAPTHFVDSVGEIFLPLLKGIPLVILPAKMEFDSQQFIQYLATHKVTRLVLVPSQLQLILDIYPNLSNVLPCLNHLEISGEPLSINLALQLKKALPKTRLLNRYGSSEYTSAIFFEIDKLNENSAWVPIGKPIHHTKTYILDENLNAVKEGAIGTLWMSGIGMSPGYLNNPELSKKQFKRNPFYNERVDEYCYEKIYNTGDRVKLNDNDDLEHRGRADYQISLYGNRFELSEIESYLNQHPAIKQSVILLTEHHSLQFLTAYVIINDTDSIPLENKKATLSLADLRQFLQNKLPSYMIPSVLIKMPHFPLLANGKINRKAFPPPKPDELVEITLEKDEIRLFIIRECKKFLPFNEINVQDNFFEIGFNSLMLMSLANYIRNQYNISCNIAELYRNETIEKLVYYIKQSVKYATDSISHSSSNTAHIADGITISQKRFWLLEKKIIADKSPYHIPILIKINGAISVRKLNQSIKDIIKENPILSSHFLVEKENITLLKHHLKWKLDLVNAEAENIDQLLASTLHKRFDLEKDWLMRACLFKMNDQHYIFSIVIHHIIFDGWSQQQFIRLIFQKYNKLNEIEQQKETIHKQSVFCPTPEREEIEWFKQQLSNIQPISLPYDFVPYSNGLEEGSALELQQSIELDCFANARNDKKRNAFEGRNSVVDRNDENRITFHDVKNSVIANKVKQSSWEHAVDNKDNRYYFTLSCQQLALFQELAKTHKSTLYLAMLTVFSVLLGRYSQTNSLSLGTVISTREDEKMDCAINTIPLLIPFNWQDNFSSLLKTISAQFYELYTLGQFNRRSDTELGQMQLNAEGNLNVFFIFESIPEQPQLHLGSATCELMIPPFQVSKSELSLNVEAYEDHLLCYFEFSPRLFKLNKIANMAANFVSLAEHSLQSPNKPLYGLNLLATEEQYKLLHLWNNESSIKHYKSLDQLFTEQALIQPEKMVVIDHDSQQYHYAFIHEKSEQIAAHLHQQIRKKNTLVGIAIDPGIHMIVGLISILKAGAAFLPLDPEYPEKRLQYILENSQTKYILTEQQYYPLFTKFAKPTTKILIIETLLDTPLNIKFQQQHLAEDLAYVLYTSGSTGQPKGVKSTHQSILNRLDWMWDQFPFQKNDQCSQKTALSFVDSLWEIFGPLLKGVPLHIFSKEQRLSIQQFTEELMRRQISWLVLTPSWLTTLMDYMELHQLKHDPLRMCIVSGETLYNSLLTHFRTCFPQAKLLNLYGSTEVAADACFYEITLDNPPLTSIPIGKPIQNMQAYVLDQFNQLLPIGVTGELCIAGLGLAQGYLDPTLTEKKFIIHSVEPDQPLRLFKTGDLATWQEDGNLILVGRNDSQIKINGMRIDLAEIEHLLHQHSQIQKTFVVAVGTAQKQIVAFIQTGDKSLTAEQISRYLNAYLPQPFIPKFIYLYDQFPQTVTGKTDRIALIQHHNSQARPLVEANTNLTEVEGILLDLFKGILPESNPKISDSFFYLGGSSLTAMVLAYRINDLFNIKLSIADIFSDPKPCDLARKIANMQQKKCTYFPPICKISRKPKKHLASSTQKTVWYAAKLQENTPWIFNVPLAIKLQGNLNIDALHNALNEIIKDNEIYQINFELIQGQLYQIFSPKPVNITVVKVDQQENLAPLMKERAMKIFNLENDALIDINLFQLANNEFCLLINHHHIITDAWSLNQFLQKLSQYYEHFAVLPTTSRDLFARPSKPIRGETAFDYLDFSTWHNQLINQETLADQISYWKNQLQHSQITSLRPDKYCFPHGAGNKGARHQISISQADLEKLKQFSFANHVSLSMTLLTAFKLVLAKFIARDDIIIGMPVANRHWPGLDAILGFFINTVAIRTKINSQGTFFAALSAVKTSYINAIKNQDIPLNYLMELLDLAMPYQIGFDFLSFQQQYKINLEHLHCEVNYLYLDTAQYDLTLFANENSRHITLFFEYKTALFTAKFINHFAEQYRQLLRQIIDENANLHSLKWLDAAEKSMILSLGHGPQKTYANDIPLITAIEKNAQDIPHHFAIRSESEELSYIDLFQRVNQLAAVIRNHLDLTKPSLRIATCLFEDTEWITSLLTIWKLGACYIPFNPRQPEQRIHSLIDLVKPDLIITHSSLANKLRLDSLQRPIFCLDKTNGQATTAKESPWNTRRDSYAYIIFTSGTTGVPKPVPIREKALLNLAYAQIEAFAIQNSSRVLQFAPCSFDASLSEITTALVGGACLYLITQNLRQDAIALSDYINNYSIDIATLPPSLLASIPKTKQLALKTLVIAGESSEPESFYFWSRNRLFINAYGPTESTICASYKKVSKNTLPGNIGKPLAHINLYVLDEQGQLLPRGAEGELYIAGEQLTDGYLQSKSNTAFCILDFNGFKQRAYRTGDKVRWLMNGDLEFIGRVDRQIKYHGIRIEPQEIEQKIRALDFVREAVVTLEDKSHLVSYTALDEKILTPTHELELWPSVAEFYVYDEFLYNVMSNDLKRNFFYQNVLNELAANQIVLDIGTGKDAILARLAVKAGAKKVYAIEYIEQSYYEAKNTLEKLNLSDRITLIFGDSRSINLPEPVDLIVSEIVGSLGGSEGAAVILNDAKKRHLKPGGLLIPDKAITRIAAVSLPDDFLTQAGFGPLAAFYAEKIYADLNYQFLPRICIKNINPDYLISNETILEELLFNENEIKTKNRYTAALKINRHAKFSGFMAWLNLYDQQENQLNILQDNHCWLPIYFPASNPNLHLQSGDLIQLDCEYRLSENDLNPDYFIRAAIWREKKLLDSFNYDSLHFHPVSQSNFLYDSLFDLPPLIRPSGTFSPVSGRREKHENLGNFYSSPEQREKGHVSLSKSLTQSQCIQFIKQQLMKQLPDYMLPKKYICLEKIPINQHGKIDYQQLTAIYKSQQEPTNRQEKPRTALEIKLSTLWSKLLSLTEMGRNDNFFHLGGDSILAIQLVSAMQNGGLSVTVHELYTYPSIASLTQYLLANNAEAINQANQTEVDGGFKYPLSSVQQNMLSLYLAYPKADLYITQVYWYVGAINEDNYQKAWLLLIAETEALRLSFSWESGESAHQFIHRYWGKATSYEQPFGASSLPLKREKEDKRKEDPINLDWHQLDWSAFSQEQQQRKLRAYLRQDRKQGFDLHKPCPMRLTLIKLQQDKKLILWTHHHIILDGWSLPLLLERLDLFYENLQTNKAKPKPYPYQFSHYIHWLTKQDKQAALLFWQQQLGEIRYPTQLSNTQQPLVNYSIDNPHRSVVDFLSSGLTAQLKQFCRSHALTVNTVLQMAWGILLSNYSGQEHVLFGTTVSGRTANVNHIDTIAGLLINTIPIAIQLNGSKTILDSLDELQRTIVQAQNHSYVGLHEIKKAIHWNQASPLFYSLTVFENYPAKSKYQLHFVEKTNFPLVVGFSLAEKLEIELSYAQAFFSPTMVHNMMGHFKEAISSMINTHQQMLSDISILPKSELLTLKHWNDTAFAFPSLTIHQAFAKMVTRYPHHVALCQGNEMMTYEQLDKKANQLAQRIHQLYSRRHQKNFPLETTIAIYLHRGMNLMISILAILKAGGCYVPLDPAYPKQRNDFIIQDANPVFIITEENLSHDLATHQDRLIHLVDDEEEEEEEIKFLALAHHPRQLAYIIYTSGSTGVPNGVLIEHRSVVNLALNTAKDLKISTTSRLLQLNSPCFDTSVQEWSLALLNGATLIIPTLNELPPHKEVGELLIEKAISHLDAPPYVIENIKKQPFPHLQVIISGGDICHQTLVDRWALNYHFINDYGPTETTICVSMTTCKAGKKPTIGKPHPNTRFYVLNQNGKLAPIGAAGELFISGVGLARGYLNRPELNRQRFIANPFQVESEDYQYLYKTGDLVQWTADGELQYLGRNDGQLKIRGYRIEPQEIENCLLKHENVKHCVVIADQEQQQKLSVFIEETKQGLLSAQDYRRFLQQRLPAFMIPNNYVSVPRIPILPNAKVDKKALTELAKSRVMRKVQDEAHTPEQAVLIEVYSQVLHCQHVDTKTNFYTIGGDSINAIHVTTLLQRKGYHFSPYLIDKYPIISELAHYLQKLSPAKVQAVIPSQPFKLSPIQCWFFARSLINPHHYNQAIMLGHVKPYNQTIVEQTLSELLKRHDSLRLRFKRQQNTWVQYYADDKKTISIPIKFYDLSQANKKERAALIASYCKALQDSLNIEKGPLHAIACFYSPDKPQGKLFWVCHHLACDTVSWYLLLTDFKKIYNALEQQIQVSHFEKKASFFNWIQALQHYAKYNAYPNQMNYWLKIVKQIKTLPFDKPAALFTQADMRHLEIHLSANQTKALLTSANLNLRTYPVELILASLLIAFNQWRELSELSIEMEGHGREPICDNLEANQIMGWFTSLYPVHFKMADCSQWIELILYVKNYLRSIPDKGLGYGVLRYLLNNQSTRKLNQAISPSLSFNYMGVLDNQGKNKTFQLLKTDANDWVSSANQSDYPLAINCYILNQQFKLNLSYSSKHFSRASIIALQRKIQQSLDKILGFCSTVKNAIYTHCDFPLVNLPQATLRQLTQNYNIDDIYPLSSLQQGLLFHASEKTDPYIAQLYWTLAEDIHAVHFKNAWHELIQSNAILRTSFHGVDGGEPVQMVHKDSPLEWHEYDWRNCLPQVANNQLTRLLSRDKEQKFDLSKPGCMRFYLIQLAKGHRLFIWSHHHIILDGWSIHLLLNQLDSLYKSSQQQSLQKQTIILLPFKHFIEWTVGQSREKALSYWRNRLQGFTESTQLLIHKTNPLKKKRSHVSLSLSDHLFRECERFCQQQTITFNTLVHAAWGIVMAKYSHQEDLVFGMTVSGRTSDLRGVENIAGLLINSIPIRLQLNKEDFVCDLIQSLQQQIRESQQFGSMSLSAIQEAIGWNGNKPLFQYLSVFENYPHHHSDLLADLKINEETHYPLSLVFSSQDNLTLTAIFNAYCFSHKLIKTMLSHISRCLQAMIKAADKPLHCIEILSPQEKTILLNTFNHPLTIDLPDKANLIAVWEQVCSVYPDNIALSHEKTTMNYAELSNRVTQFATFIQAQYYLKHNQPLVVETAIPLLLDKGSDQIIAILSVLKLGCMYVPLEPSLPQGRIETILAEIKSQLIITTSLNRAKFSDSKNSLVIDIDAPWQTQAANLMRFPELHSKNLAYMIFTSGTTGKPKGIMIEHGSVLNYVNWMTKELALTRRDHFMQSSSYGFDASIWEIFVPLLTGAQLSIPGTSEKNSFTALVQWMKQKTISIAQFVPSLLPLLLETPEFGHLSNLRYLCAGGEELAYGLVKSLLEQNDCEIINLYGPTEVTIDASFKRINRSNLAQCNPIPIGSPLLNTQIHILDPYHQLTPIGVAGELCVTGIGLARGYYRNKALTDASFIDNPFNVKKQRCLQRLYKTGDLARWLANGEIEYLGRKDSQVKIRGNRIELSEIKEHLLRLDRIKQAELILIGNEEKKIIAFCTENNNNSQPLEDYVRKQLSDSLPHYMIPAACISLKQFPLNANDKIDYSELVKIYQTIIAATQENYFAQDAIIADSLNLIWKHLFKLHEINQHANFYELGGHSLKAMQMALQIETYLRIGCPVTVIFNHPQFSDLVSYLSQQKLKQQSSNTIFVDQPDSQQLSAEQKRIWFLSQLNSKINHSYNMWSSFLLEGDLNLDLFAKSLNWVVKNNEILRATYQQINNEVIQVIAEELIYPLEISLIKSELPLEQFILGRVNQPFALETRCWDAFLFKLTSNNYLFLLTMHHIIGDGWSLKLMMNELAEHYNQLSDKSNACHSSKPYQYRHYTAWQQQFLASPEAQAQLIYWKNKLAQYEPITLPYKNSPLKEINFDSQQFKFTINKQQLNQIKGICEKESCTTFMFVYSILNVLLYKFTLQTDIIIGFPISQRMLPNSDQIMGCLLNTLVLRHQFSSQDSFISLLQSSKTLCLEAYENQLIPFDHVVKISGAKRTPLRNPLFQVMINWHSQDETIQFHLHHLAVKTYDIPVNLIKFDLSFNFTQTDDALYVCLEYSKNLFSRQLMQQMKMGFQNILAAVINDSQITLSSLGLLTQKQQQRLLQIKNCQENFSLPGNDLYELFYQQVIKFPEKRAIKHGEQTISYKQLYDESLRLASYLPQKKKIIAIVLERSVSMVSAILAILASENAFLLIDPTITPLKRIQEQIAQCEINTIISSTQYNSVLSNFSREFYSIINLDSLNKNVEIQRIYRKIDGKNHDKIAYIIFTSGTTNNAKAIKIKQRNLINHLCWRKSLFKLSDKDIVLQKTHVSFDASIWEFFLPLMLGASSIIIDNQSCKQPDKILQIIQSEKVTIAQFVPSILELILQSTYARYLQQLHHLCLGGEIFSRQLYQKCRSVFQGNIYNLYGPAETTIDVAYYHATDRQISTNLPIGVPLPHVNLYIVDEGLNRVPKGCIGELAISGYAVGDGYLNNVDLTRKKFIANPFSQSPEHSTLYLSGDLVRLNSQNLIEFIGRQDQQIKFHGIRIDLREIEYYLEQHDNVKSCRVLHYEHHKKQYLISFLVENNPSHFSSSYWKNYLGKHLAEYMCPAYYFSVETIPCTANGKTDEQQLKKLADSYFSKAPGSSINKEDAVTRQLKLIWTKVLGHHQFNIQDDFFLVGGDSLLAVHLINQINDRFSCSLAITWAFTHTSIVQQAEILRLGYNISYMPITQLNLVDKHPTLFIIHSGTGGAEVYHLLAATIERFSIYGIEPYNFYHPDTMIDNIPELAEYYLQLIKKQQAQGPYYLAGWSLGGLIAFEIAHKLQKSGQEVALIYLLDSFIYDVNLAYKITQFYEANIANPTLFIRLTEQSGLPESYQQRLTKLMLNNCKMLQQYKPAYYSGKAILFKATQKEIFNKTEFSSQYIETVHRLHDLVDNGWGKWIQQLEIHTVNCKHTNLLAGDHLLSLAQRIDATVNEIRLKDLK